MRRRRERHCRPRLALPVTRPLTATRPPASTVPISAAPAALTASATPVPITSGTLATATTATTALALALTLLLLRRALRVLAAAPTRTRTGGPVAVAVPIAIAIAIAATATARRATRIRTCATGTGGVSASFRRVARSVLLIGHGECSLGHPRCGDGPTREIGDMRAILAMWTLCGIPGQSSSTARPRRCTPSSLM